MSFVYILVLSCLVILIGNLRLFVEDKKADMSFVYILVFSCLVILIGNFRLFIEDKKTKMNVGNSLVPFGLMILVGNFTFCVEGCTEISDIKVNSDFVQLGSNATLLCSVDNSDRRNKIRKWTRGKKDELLTFETSSINSNKFQPTTNHLEFGLIIYNITNQDVNIIYTCSCGFAKKTIILQLTERRIPHNDATTLTDTSKNVILVMFALFACGLQ